MSNIIDLSGNKFGQLVVIGRARSNKLSSGGLARWCCLCDCGLYTIATGTDLRSGHTTSCGHLKDDMLKEGLHVTNGQRRGRKSTPEYEAWLGMRTRCYNKDRPGFSNYGGRGIKVCRRWRRSFDAFLKDVGKRPGPEYSIDRIDNDGDYTPGNVRWATAKEQANNRRARRS